MARASGLEEVARAAPVERPTAPAIGRAAKSAPICSATVTQARAEFWAPFAQTVESNRRPTLPHCAFQPPLSGGAPGDGPAGYHGIVLVPNVVERTPPFIEDTLPGSPAAKAGLRPDDLIVYIDGEKVISIKEFRDIVEKARPGTAFRLEVRRGDKLMTVDLKLDAPPGGVDGKQP